MKIFLEKYLDTNITILRDDKLKGGSKSRFVNKLINKKYNYVYCSPRCGGFQIALATQTKKNIKIVIFTPYSMELHPCTKEAKDLGAEIKQIKGGYMTNLVSKSKKYVEEKKLLGEKWEIIEIGGNCDIAINSISNTMKKCIKKLGYEPDEIWCAIGSGTLCRGILKGTKKAKVIGVQVGKEVEIKHPRLYKYKYHKKFNLKSRIKVNFKSNPHYDLKAFEYCLEKSNKNKKILFWNVL